MPDGNHRTTTSGCNVPFTSRLSDLADRPVNSSELPEFSSTEQVRMSSTKLRHCFSPRDLNEVTHPAELVFIEKCCGASAPEELASPGSPKASSFLLEGHGSSGP